MKINLYNEWKIRRRKKVLKTWGVLDPRIIAIKIHSVQYEFIKWIWIKEGGDLIRTFYYIVDAIRFIVYRKNPGYIF